MKFKQENPQDCPEIITTILASLQSAGIDASRCGNRLPDGSVITWIQLKRSQRFIDVVNEEVWIVPYIFKAYAGDTVAAKILSKTAEPCPFARSSEEFTWNEWANPEHRIPIDPDGQYLESLKDALA